MKLYEIPFAIRTALDSMQVDEETGEILNAPDIALVEGEAADKIESAGLYIREIEVEAEALREEASRMYKRADALDRKIHQIKRLIEPALDALNGKVKGSRMTVYFRKSEQVVVDIDADKLPEGFVKTRTTVSPDKTAIKNAIKSGEAVEGCSLLETRSVCMR